MATWLDAAGVCELSVKPSYMYQENIKLWALEHKWNPQSFLCKPDYISGHIKELSGVMYIWRLNYAHTQTIASVEIITFIHSIGQAKWEVGSIK